MVSFIVFDETSGKLLFQHCSPSLWNILDKKLHSFHDDDEYEKLTVNNQDIHETNLLMQNFFPFLLSVKMLKCRVIRTTNWTVCLNRNNGKFITILVGESGIRENELLYYQNETNKLVESLCGGDVENLKESKECQRKFKIHLNHLLERKNTFPNQQREEGFVSSKMYQT